MHNHKHFRLALFAILSGLINSSAWADVPPIQGLREVPHECVELQGGFWEPRLKTHVEVTIPHALNKLEEDGHVTNFDKAAGVTKGLPAGHRAFDSDLHKALEGAMVSLHHQSDKALLKRVDSILDRVLAAQQDDGFLVSYFILKEQQYRWDGLRTAHQMYNAGHYFEMAIEHHKRTGNPRVLNSAKRFADHIDGIFGPNKRYDVDGHQEIELALVKLYRATGERRYLELSKFFLDERGYQHGTERKPFDPSTPVIAPDYEKDLPDRAKGNRARARRRDGRAQDHKPVVKQMDAVGHAVRAGYMYAAMTDIVRFMKAPGYERALDSLWDDVVGRKMYVDGGVGTAQYGAEDFGDPYLLPNRTYCETCAAVAHVLWQHRMNLLKADAKYADVMELTLYNGVLSGISLSGNQFNYRNPLEHNTQRRDWIGLSCCPTNMARIIPQVGGLAYAQGKDELYVNLFVEGVATISREDESKIKLTQKTNYPWDGKVEIQVAPQKPTDFELCVRIPGWAKGKPVPSDLYRFGDPKPVKISLQVNGKSVDATAGKDGYVHLRRTWKKGDVVKLDLPMPVRRVYAHEKVEADRGKVALMRGPIVYCFEGVAGETAGGKLDLNSLMLPRQADIVAVHGVTDLGGATVLKTNLQQTTPEGERSPEFLAIPRYGWGNRSKEPRPMTVWINESTESK